MPLKIMENCGERGQILGEGLRKQPGKYFHG